MYVCIHVAIQKDVIRPLHQSASIMTDSYKYTAVHKQFSSVSEDQTRIYMSITLYGNKILFIAGQYLVILQLYN